jgi:hypothetical protein
MAVFWVVAPCSLVEVYQRFRGPRCLHHQGDHQTHRPGDGGVRISETLVNFYHTTRRYNPEDNHLHTRHRENLKSYRSPVISSLTLKFSTYTSRLHCKYLKSRLLKCHAM